MCIIYILQSYIYRIILKGTKFLENYLLNIFTIIQDISKIKRKSFILPENYFLIFRIRFEVKTILSELKLKRYKSWQN